MTQGQSGPGMEGMSGMSQMGSDRRLKENVVCIAKHPLGFGLYLFDYKAELREKWGHGRQFGVMADEVERVMPEAVTVDCDGHRRVDYGKLGITRPISRRPSVPA